VQDVDADAVLTWLDNYCRANPLDGVGTASSKLLIELLLRKDGQTTLQQAGKMLDKFPSTVAAATFIVLSLAVTHEWGYYAQFDPHIQGLVAPSDYLKSALLWLPTIAITYFVMATLTVLQWRAADFRFGPQRGQRIVHLTGIGFVVLSALASFDSSPVEAWLVYSIPIAYVWSQIVGYLVRHEEVAKRFTFGALMLTLFLPMGLASAYSSGLSEGRRRPLETERANLHPNFQRQGGAHPPCHPLESLGQGRVGTRSGRRAVLRLG
jgi:hypothetical protein